MPREELATSASASRNEDLNSSSYTVAYFGTQNDSNEWWSTLAENGIALVKKLQHIYVLSWLGNLLNCILLLYINYSLQYIPPSRASSTKLKNLLLAEGSHGAKAKETPMHTLIPRPPSYSTVSVTEMVTPSMADERDVVYGGFILSFIDVAAGICAKRHATRPAVTASVDAVHFLKPILVGEFIVITATVTRTWRSSMEVSVTVISENPRLNTRRFCSHAYLTFVALKEGKPTPVPALVPQSINEKEEYRRAEERRLDRVKKGKAGLRKDMERVREVFLGGGDVRAQKDLAEIATPKENSSARKELSASANLQSIKSESSQPRRWSEVQSSQPAGPKETKTLGPERAPSPSRSEPIQRTPLPANQLSASSSRTYAEVSRLILPPHANSLGITFGGYILRWIESTAYISATRHTASHMVTVSVDSVQFLGPTLVGDVVIIRSMVTTAWNHSVECYVTVEREDESGQRTFTNDAFVTFACVDLVSDKRSVNDVGDGQKEEASPSGQDQKNYTLPKFKLMRVPPIAVDPELAEKALERKQRRDRERQLVGENFD